MTFLVVANFKSHKTLTEVVDWLKDVALVTKSLVGVEAVVAPSFPHLASGQWPPSLKLAAQDCSPFPPGSYTGAVNAQELQDLGVSYCIVGHSERRRYFHETTSEIAGKVRELVSVGITPIVCMEEKDLVPQFATLGDGQIAKCIFCFEPSGDIGGTTTAPHDLIKSVQLKVSEFAPNSPFMYGGSVTGDNITGLLTLGLSGVLVATASLESNHYLSILRASAHAA